MVRGTCMEWEGPLNPCNSLPKPTYSAITVLNNNASDSKGPLVLHTLLIFEKPPTAASDLAVLSSLFKLKCCRKISGLRHGDTSSRPFKFNSAFQKLRDKFLSKFSVRKKGTFQHFLKYVPKGKQNKSQTQKCSYNGSPFWYSTRNEDWNKSNELYHTSSSGSKVTMSLPEDSLTILA